MQSESQWRQWLTKNHPLTSNKVNKCLLSANFLLVSNWRGECKTMLSDNLKCFPFSTKAPEILHVIFNWTEKHHPVFFFTGLLFVFEILHMQKLVFVVTSTRDCTDGNFTENPAKYWSFAMCNLKKMLISGKNHLNFDFTLMCDPQRC